MIVTKNRIKPAVCGDWLRNRKKPAVSFLVNVFVLCVLLLLFDPVEKTDDLVMKHILSGSMSGEPSAHLLYVNFLLGSILKLLQSVFPGAAWFEVFQYIVLFVSFWVFTCFTWDEGDRKKSALLTLPVLFFFGFEAYIRLTFTKTAGIVIAVGLYSLGREFAKENPKIIRLMFSSIFVILGSCIRYNITMALAAFFAGGSVVYILRRYMRHKSLDGKKIWKFTCFLLLTFGMVYMVRILGDRLFQLDPQWKAYKEYNMYKKELQDYGWPDYKENRKGYEGLGVTANDYRLWTSRDYAHADILSMELMEKICGMKEKEGIEKYVKNIGGYFKEYPLTFMKVNVFYPAAVLLILLFFSEADRKGYLYFYVLGAMLLLEYYLYCKGRYGRQHIDVPFFFAAAAFISYFMAETKLKKNAMRCCVPAVLLLSLAAVNTDYEYITSSRYDGGAYTIAQEPAREVVDVLTADKECLYVLSDEEYYGLMRCFGTFETVPPKKMSNIFILSSYMYPSHRVVLESFGCSNIYADFCKENVRYVTSYGKGNVDVILKYIQEHYCETADYVMEDSMHGVNIYQFFDKSDCK